jgi:hypothetical protein
MKGTFSKGIHIYIYTYIYTYIYIKYIYIYINVKGKEATLQAWSGPEGFRKLRFPDFVRAAKPLPPENTPVTHFC